MCLFGCSFFVCMQLVCFVSEVLLFTLKLVGEKGSSAGAATGWTGRTQLRPVGRYTFCFYERPSVFYL